MASPGTPFLLISSHVAWLLSLFKFLLWAGPFSDHRVVLTDGLVLVLFCGGLALVFVGFAIVFSSVPDP